VGFVKWLYEEGDTLNWLNYMDIVLVSQLPKLFERAVLERLLVRIETEKPLSDLDVRHQLWLVMQSLQSRGRAALERMCSSWTSRARPR
jgi:hypothetical protein